MVCPIFAHVSAKLAQPLPHPNGARTLTKAGCRTKQPAARDSPRGRTHGSTPPRRLVAQWLERYLDTRSECFNHLPSLLSNLLSISDRFGLSDLIESAFDATCCGAPQESSPMARTRQYADRVNILTFLWRVPLQAGKVAQRCAYATTEVPFSFYLVRTLAAGCRYIQGQPSTADLILRTLMADSSISCAQDRAFHPVDACNIPHADGERVSRQHDSRSTPDGTHKVVISSATAQ